jgi:AraC family transcriptional regulator
VQPLIKILTGKKLIGKKIRMSFANNKTMQLWQSFMPQRKEIKNTFGTELYSIEVYSDGYFNDFDPANEFDKWAAVEVSNYDIIPSGMETIVFPTGLYAVFNYKGTSAEAYKAYDHIFRNWLPQSGYVLDHRPHFAVMGEKYKRDDASSEEEIWIPVKES